MNKIFTIILLTGFVLPAESQTVSSTTDWLSINLKDDLRKKDVDFPVIRWVCPANEFSSTKENSALLQVYVNSSKFLDSSKLIITNAKDIKTTFTLPPPTGVTPKQFFLNQRIPLSKGLNTIELVAKTTSGDIVVGARDIFYGEKFPSVRKTATDLKMKEYSVNGLMQGRQLLDSMINSQIPGPIKHRGYMRSRREEKQLDFPTFQRINDNREYTTLEVPQSNESPNAGSLIIVDGVFTSEGSGSLKRNIVTGLRMLVRNDGNEPALIGMLWVEFPPQILAVSQQAIKIGTINPGETKQFEFDFDITNSYTENHVPFKTVLTDGNGVISSTRTFIAQLDQSLVSMVSLSQPANAVSVTPTPKTLRSNVDVDIPHNQGEHPNYYALVIGNEDYAQFQPGLIPSQNVVFARNDAIAFRDYLVKSFGFPERQVFLVTNATREQMTSEVDRLCELAKLNPESEVVVYYAGHGAPDAKTNKAYMIPVDVTGNDYRDGMNLGELYKKLAETKAARIILFLDACFSGGGRGENGLLATRSVHIKTNGDEIDGNLIVVSATNGEEVALPLVRESHGLFTYCLLKMMQSSHGNFNLGQLKDYLDIEVPKSSLIENGIRQTPQILVSPKLQSHWKTWTF